MIRMNFGLNSVPNGAELGVVTNIKVVDICLGFPNNFSFLNLEICSLSYTFLNKDSCCYNLRTDFESDFQQKDGTFSS